MRLSGQFQVCLFFFLRKDFERKKTHHKQKPTNKTKISNKKQQRWQYFAPKNFKGCETRFFCILVLFYKQNFFVKKKKQSKINRLEIALITSFAMLLINSFNIWIVWICIEKYQYFLSYWNTTPYFFLYLCSLYVFYIIKLMEELGELGEKMPPSYQFLPCNVYKRTN